MPINKKIFSKKERGIGQLIFGIFCLVLGVMWNLRVIKTYSPEGVNLIDKLIFSFQFLPSFYYGVVFVLGGIILIGLGLKGLKKK